MTIIEKKSLRKKKAIMNLVATGEMSIAYALMEAERLNDEGKLLDANYEELAEYLESLLTPEVEEPAYAGEQNATEENVESEEE